MMPLCWRPTYTASQLLALSLCSSGAQQLGLEGSIHFGGSVNRKPLGCQLARVLEDSSWKQGAPPVVVAAQKRPVEGS